MISKQVWQRAICVVREDAAASLSSRCDIGKVFSLLDELADEKPPRINDLGDAFLMAKVQIARRLQEEMTSDTVQLWLDEFSIELTSTNDRE